MFSQTKNNNGTRLFRCVTVTMYWVRLYFGQPDSRFVKDVIYNPKLLLLLVTFEVQSYKIMNRKLFVTSGAPLCVHVDVPRLSDQRRDRGGTPVC